MRRLIAMMLIATVGPALAGEIYRSYDADGNPVYSDQPPYEGAEPIEPARITITPGTDAAQPRDSGTDSDRNAKDREEATTDYAGVELVFPPREEAIRRVTGEVEVQARLAGGAELRDGHRMKVFMDGAEVGSGDSLSVTVGPLDPGPHEVHVEIVDASGQVRAESRPYRFYLIRQTVSN